MIRKASLASALVLALATSAVTASSKRAAEGSALLTPLPISSVEIQDAFWSPKLDTWRNVTIKDCLDRFEKDGTLANFDHVVEGGGKHGGMPWFDGLLYEMIRASADFMAAKPDAVLKARLDGYIDRIAAAAAKDPDGYINTYTTLKEPTHRWGQNGGNDRWQHDLYNEGCLIEAGIHYYKATGDTRLLAVATKAANGMVKVMGPAPRQNVVPGHAIPEEAMVKLYELFKAEPALKDKLGVPVAEADYLALARFWIDIRGTHTGRTDFGAYNQDAVPGLQQTSIEGHAVRAALFNSGMIAYGRAANDPRYIDVASRMWDNMVSARMYITGGIGSFANDEKFGPDYVLPNDGYLETCAAVASGFFSENLHLIHGDAATVDELERSLYNNTLAGVAMSGHGYFYENPLESSPKRQRWAWHECPCCPPMFLKLMGALPTYIYSVGGESGAYVNLFIGSTGRFKLAGSDVTLKQTTQYPNDGAVRIEVSASAPAEFDLYIRVPGWTRGGATRGNLYSTAAIKDGFKLMVNGQPMAAPVIERGYAKVRRSWKTGDVVDISMQMPVQRVFADPRVEADRGKVALMRGPLVYCLESPDNGGSLTHLYLPADATITASSAPELLGGVTVLKATGRRVTGEGSESPAELLAIPYYSNANRGPVDMRTWIPTAAPTAPAAK